MVATRATVPVVHPNVLNADYHSDGITNKVMTAEERIKLSGIEEGADVTDSTNVDAAGAVMNTDTTTTEMAFVGTGSDLSQDGGKLAKREDVANYVAVTPPPDGAVTDAKVALGSKLYNRITGPIDPRDVGVKFDAATDDTEAWDDLFAYLRTSVSRRCVVMPQGRSIYNGAGMSMTGYLWDIHGQGHSTELYRTTDGPFFIFDIRTQAGGESSIGGFRQLSNLASGSRPNTYGIKIVSEESSFFCNNVRFEKMNWSGLRAGIWFDKTAGDAWGEVPNQIGRYHAHSIIDNNADGTSPGGRCDFGVVFSSGTGDATCFVNNVLATADTAVKLGDGVQSVGDITFVGNHFFGALIGLDVLGPTDPTFYKRNLCVVGGQFDGNSVYPWRVRNMNQWQILPNNSLQGVSPSFSNCSNYIFYDAFGREVYDTRTMSGNLIVDDVSGVRYVNTLAARKSDNESFLAISGGNSISAGARINLYGGAHPTTSLRNRTFIDNDRLDVRSQNGATTIFAANAAGNQLGFYGATPTSKPTVSGAKGGNAALGSLLTALANLGLIADSST